MKPSDYPALYQSSSDLSANSQSAFFRALSANLLFLVLAALISIVNSPCAEAAIVQAIVLTLSLFSTIYLFFLRPERHWYSGRAVAESIKTITWRFITRAEPFHDEDEMAEQKFGLKLKQIVEQNTDVAKRLTTHLDELQITPKMRAYRQLDLQNRRQLYLDSRIVDQQSWYAKKAAFNDKKVKQFFALLILTNVLAICFAIIKVRYPTAGYWPTDVLVTVAASILSWIQAKRFQELSASYALTAHEISLIREQAARSMNEGDFSEFVGNAENAFSREHTQWIARRDN